MPYKVVKRGPKWFVEKPNGKDFGAHDTEADAKKQMAALYAAEPKLAAAATGDIRALHLHRALGTAKIEMIDKREYLVVPVVALMEGVIHAVNAETPEFVPLTTLQKAAATWNGKPVTLGHPKRDGKQCSASAPGVAEAHGIGFIRNSRVEGTKMLQEACIDKIKAKQLAPDMWERLLADTWEEVSVGAFVVTDGKPGKYTNGKQYHGSWIDTAGDHLAFLPGGRGACSIEMGCGAHRAAMRVCEASLELEVLGDVPGHEFHGNQYSSGTSGGTTGEKLQKAGYNKTYKERSVPDHHKGSVNLSVPAGHTTYAKEFSSESKAFAAQDKFHYHEHPGAVSSSVVSPQASNNFYSSHVHEVTVKNPSEHSAPQLSKKDMLREDAERVKAGKEPIHKEALTKLYQKEVRGRGPSLRENAAADGVFAFTTLEGQSLDERIRAVNDAVSKKWNNNAAVATGGPSEYAYSKQVFDDSVIVEVGSKCYALPYDVNDDGTVTLGEATEVKMTYVAAEKEHDCHCGGACDDCKHEHRAAAGARHSAGDMKLIQAMHDQAISLGATCDRGNT